MLDTVNLHDDPYSDPDYLAILRYCQYQERCHSEVRNKLYELGVRHPKTDELIAMLIERDILNEERFAIAYARGKFRMKQWGRIKIKNGLKLKQVSDYCIKKAINNINNNEYYNVLIRLADQQLGKMKSADHPAVRKEKLFRYLMQKGYEPNLIHEVVKNLLSDSSR